MVATGDTVTMQPSWENGHYYGVGIVLKVIYPKQGLRLYKVLFQNEPHASLYYAHALIVQESLSNETRE